MSQPSLSSGCVLAEVCLCAKVNHLLQCERELKGVADGLAPASLYAAPGAPRLCLCVQIK